MFSICKRTFRSWMAFTFIHNTLYIAHTGYHTRTNERSFLRSFLYMYKWVGCKWLKFTMSYIPIQSFVVGINVAIQLLVGSYIYFFPFLLFHEHHSTCAVVYICATNTRPNNQLKHFFPLLFSSAIFFPFTFSVSLRSLRL